MNRIFRIIWSQALNTWVVVSELATRQGKRSSGGAVDECAAPPASTLDRDMIEGSPPVTAWPLRRGIFLALRPRRTARVPVLWHGGLLAALLVGVIAPVHATDYYWDTNSTTTGAGGPTPSGVWSSTDLTLTTDANGNLVVAPHATTTADRLFFSAGTDATGSYTVNVSGTQNIGRLTFQEGNVLLTGGTINFGAVAGQIDADTSTDTIASVITGTNGFTIAGGPTTSLRLAGTNTFTGLARIGSNVTLAAAGGNALSGNQVAFGAATGSVTGGSVTLGAANQINDTALVTINNATTASSFSLNGFNETIAGIIINNGTFAAGTATIRNGAATDATLTLAGSGAYNAGLGSTTTARSITDGGAGKLNIVKAGTGTQYFTGTEATYTGTTTINSGILRLINTSTWASNITLNGGTLYLDQNSTGTTAYAGAAVRTHANTIGGTGGTLLKASDGTVILSGINTYQGGTRVSGGTLQAGSTSAFGNNSAVTLASGGVLNLNGFNNSIGSLAHSSTTSSGTVQLGSATLTTGGNNTSTKFSGVIAGSGNLVKVGTGTQWLGGTNTYTGTTTISDGTLEIGFVGAVSPNVSDGTTGTLGTGAVSLGAAGALAFGRTNLYTVNNTITGAGALAQVGTGTTTLTAVNSVGATTVSAGTLDINNVLNTDTVTMGNGTLNVDGTVQASGATQAVFSGTAGTASTVTIGSGGTLLASGDLGDGSDSLDVSGTLDTGAGALNLGDGDDNFFIHDGTNVLGTVIGGAGMDTYIYDIAGVANVGALSEFEGLTKRGAGTVNLTGPGVSDLANVRVEQGTLNVGAGATVVAQATGSLDTLVAAGTTLNVDGSYTASTNSDTFDVSGTVSGIGMIDLNDGDDNLVLHDGADLSGLTNAIDGGTGNDTFVADLAGNATLGGAVNFETLTKTNTGTLNVAGPAGSTFSTVNVDGGLLNIGAAGVLNGVSSASVASGATLNIAGTFGFTPGADTLTVAGTVTGAGGLNMLDGDDVFTIQDGADLSGLATPVDGGLGTDMLTADIAGTATLGGAINFETLTKTNTGTLNINGSANSQFDTVRVQDGTLVVGAGAIVDPQTTVVSSGTTMTVNGTYNGTAGADTFTVSGTVNGTGTIDLLGDDDILTLNDGADLSGLANPLDGGAHVTGDTVVLNNTAALNFDSSKVVNFESLVKANTGSATLTGAGTFSNGTAINAGTLDVDGALETPTVTLADGTTLNVGGSVQGAGATQAVITGSAGSNTVSVGAGGTLLATGDLGNGGDVLDVAGTLDIGGGVFALGDGDDTFTVHDSSNVIGTVDGGAGLDTRIYDINGAANLGALLNFEGVTKTGTGTLNINGPGATDLQKVSVLNGALNIGAGASVVATVGSSLDTVVASGAVLNVDGSYTGSAGSDGFDVSGTVNGSGTIDLAAGDDTLTLNDGAVLNDVIDGGGNGTGDTILLNNANAFSFDGSNTINFENLQKDNTGTATLVGTLNYTGTAINGGTLDVDGTLNTSTVTLADDTALNVDGTVQAGVGTTMSITGSAGSNKVSIGAGGTLLATGDLGAGDDVLDVAGTLDTAGGVFALGDGNDTLTIHDGTTITGTVAAGTGNDTFNTDIATTADLGAVQGFETLSKTGVGVLNINGPMSSDFSTVHVLAGTLNVAATGSVAAKNTTVSSGATLNVDGSLTGTSGDDTMDVAGAVMGSGTVALLDGNDTLTVHDGADTNGLANVIDGGAGTDTVNADVAGTMTLGQTVNFETLQKSGAGELALQGNQTYDTTLVDAGVLMVAAGTTLTSQNTTVAAGATMNVQGAFGGTASDDRFVSRGSVIGALAFGAGNDSVDFIGGDVSGVTALDGGAGTDRLGFSGLTLDGQSLPTLTSWERVELLDGSALTLANPFDLGGGVLAIDATSQLLANAGAAIGGDVENAGLIDAGANRLAIHGNYAGNDGMLQLTVSPGTLSTGGLDIDGDVRGTTRIAFGSDGSDAVGAGKASILVISSPNDDPGTSGSFVPANTVNGAVRLNGSLFPWTFGQAADHNWYLDAQAGLLPEIPAYGVLPTLATLMAGQEDDMVHQRLTGIRGTERPACGHQPEAQAETAGTRLVDDCHGVWVAASGSSTDLGANPGFAASGSDVGLYIGADYAAESDGQMVRLGAFLGYLHGNYGTTGVNSTGLPGTGAASIRLDTPVGGWYGSLHWTNGAYVDVVVSGQNPHARVPTADGFTESLTGNGVTVSAKTGKRFTLDNGWTLEPQLKLSASQVEWNDQVDATNRELTFTNHWVNAARAGLRMETTFTTDSGATIKPWVTLAVEHTFGQGRDGLQIAEPGADGNVLALPNQDLGTTARLDAGVEAKLNPRVSLFGVLSASHDLNGSSYRERAANLGIRVRW